MAKAIHEVFGNSNSFLHILEEMKAYLQEVSDAPIEFDEQLVRKLIENVAVYEDRLTVEFKYGLETDVEI